MEIKSLLFEPVKTFDEATWASDNGDFRYALDNRGFVVRYHSGMNAKHWLKLKVESVGEPEPARIIKKRVLLTNPPIATAIEDF